jgi:hypothetical protein
MEIAKIEYYFSCTNLAFKSFDYLSSSKFVSNIINLLTPKNLAFISNELIL